MSVKPFLGLLCLTLAVALLAGCGSSESARPAAAPPRAANPPPPPPVPAAAQLPPTAPQSPAPPPPAPKAPDTVQVKAEKGVGAKGHYGTGVIATPAASYFAMRERIAFEMQIPHSMNLFKASEGRAPKSHEEFMERIIKENHIPLPELPEGERYQYDPKTELLMVLKPAPE